MTVTAPASDARGFAPPSRLAWRFAWVLLLVALDLWSKHAVFAWLGDAPDGLEYSRTGHPRYPLVGEWLGFMLQYNPGMAWGFNGLPPGVLVGGRVLAVVFLGWLVTRANVGRPVLTLALVLILAGALGNLHDNLLLEPVLNPDAPFGEVRDFIDVFFPMIGDNGWHFPTFNVADSCITVGAVCLFLSSLGGSEERVEQSGPAPAAEAVEAR